MLIDGGLPSAFPIVREHLRKAVPVGPIEIDLIVVSHIDSDHIGGLLALLDDSTLDLRIGDIWFNGLPQLPENASSAKRSVRKGSSSLPR
jgi:flavorubredoxin